MDMLVILKQIAVKLSHQTITPVFKIPEKDCHIWNTKHKPNEYTLQSTGETYVSFQSRRKLQSVARLIYFTYSVKF